MSTREVSASTVVAADPATVFELLADAPRRASMRKALQELAVVDSASRICDIILDLAKTHKS